MTEGAARTTNVQIASFLHDIRWWDDEEKKIRRIRPQENDNDFPSATELLDQLKGRRRISQKAYVDILEAIMNHNVLPQPEAKRSLTTRCLADADRLSRFGISGLLSILEANANYAVPFYNPGSEIIRPEDAQMIPFGQIRSCIDDVNACLDWLQIMETVSGQDLANYLSRINRVFLQTFQLNQNLGYDFWIPWLKSIAYTQAPQQEELDRLLNHKQLDAFRIKIISVENPDLIPQARFAN